MVVFKANQGGCVYDRDPAHHPDAVTYTDTLTFQDVLSGRVRLSWTQSHRSQGQLHPIVVSICGQGNIGRGGRRRADRHQHHSRRLVRFLPIANVIGHGYRSERWPQVGGSHQRTFTQSARAVPTFLLDQALGSEYYGRRGNTFAFPGYELSTQIRHPGPSRSSVSIVGSMALIEKAIQ